MALAKELNVKDQGPLSEESSGKPYGEVIRDYEAVPGVQWRFGKPNYARVNKLYFEHRSKVHAEGSLEAVVNKLVKNWEVESHHIADPRQWKTMDTSKFWASVNGGTAADAQTMADVGPYNMLLGDTASYTGSALSFQESNSIFGSTFADGYAFEVLEVLSGPPTVTFKWRHFGKFSGVFTDSSGVKHHGNGEILNLFGLCIAKVSDSLIIESLEVYYSPEDLLRPLVKAAGDSDVPSDEGDVRTAARKEPGPEAAAKQEA